MRENFDNFLIHAIVAKNRNVIRYSSIKFSFTLSKCSIHIIFNRNSLSLNIKVRSLNSESEILNPLASYCSPVCLGELHYAQPDCQEIND